MTARKAETFDNPKGVMSPTIDPYMLVQSVAPQVETMVKDYGSAEERLLPRVRWREYYELAKLKRGNAEGNRVPPHELITEHLGVHVVMDFPSAVVAVEEAMLTGWNRDFDSVKTRALENLRRRTTGRMERVDRGTYMSPWCDSYDATRVIFIDMIQKLEVQGEHVAMIPCQSEMMVTGSENHEALQRIAERILRAYPGDGSVVSFRPLVLRGGKWETFVPAGSNTLRQLYRLLDILDTTDTYASQRQALIRVLPNDVAVPECLAAHRLDDNSYWSHCTWPDAQEVLLPKADVVSFGPVRDSGNMVVLWEVLTALAGHLMEPTELYPPRFRVRGLPGPDVMKQLLEAGAGSGLHG